MKSAVFVDGSNMHASCKAINLDVDYRKVLKFFGTNLLHAYYYTAMIPSDDGKNILRPLIDYLSYNGWLVVTKEAKVFTDDTGVVVKVKGNMDMEIAVDAMRLARYVDNIILFSGDGDFSYLVTAIQQLGVSVTIVSTLCARHFSTSPMIADELRRSANTFIDLDLIRGEIGRDSR